MSLLDRKLGRDLRRIKGQAIAVALVMGCGLAMMVMARSLIFSLENTRLEYYQENRFAEVFAALKRAPASLAARVAEIPGVAAVQASISVQVTLDVPDLEEPASGMVESLPDEGVPELNRLFLRAGSWLPAHSRGRVLVSEAFSDANHLHPGDHLAMILNGKRQELLISGIVLSPEFVFESRPGAALPDPRTYGTFWMPYKELATAFQLDGAFNRLSLTLAPGASERSVIAGVDSLVQIYGGRGAYGRADHPSHVRVSDEIRVLRTLSLGFPFVFLSVAAFMINSVLTRLLALQREQIAILKAFGFGNAQIVLHYLKFALAMVAAGTVLGGTGGVLLGHQLVQMYHRFFRFPDLHFRPDRVAFPLALLVCLLAALAGVFAAVRRAARLPPAEAMRPEPPSNYRPALLERTGIGRWLSHSFRIAARNLERRPSQAFFTIIGLALATGILIVPNAFRDGVNDIMDFQWDMVQRQDLSLGLLEPDHVGVEHQFAQLPGVRVVEPARNAYARIGFGRVRRQLVIQGMPAEALHSRVMDEGGHRVKLPDRGLVLSAKLGEVLGVRVGDLLEVEFLEGRRRSLAVPLAGFAQDFAGVAAYMELHALNRVMGEGDMVNGATVTIDAAKRPEFMRALKGLPRVSWLAIKESLRQNFRETTAASIGLIQAIYMAFAVVVAFGVVYNNARISLSERARELATLRVIGFTRREVAGALITELVILGCVAVPLGLLIGTGFAATIIGQVNTETVRLPLILTPANYAFAASVVITASVVSSIAVLRQLERLDLVGALKAPE